MNMRMAVVVAVVLAGLGLGGCPPMDGMVGNDNGGDNGNVNDGGTTNDNGADGNTNTNGGANTNDNGTDNSNTNTNTNTNANTNVNANANDNGTPDGVTQLIVGTFAGTIDCTRFEDTTLTAPSTTMSQRNVTVVFDASGRPVSVHIENVEEYSNPDFDADIQDAGETDTVSANSVPNHPYTLTATIASAAYTDNSLVLMIDLTYAAELTGGGMFIETGTGTQTVEFTLNGDMLTYTFSTVWNVFWDTAIDVTIDQTLDCTGTLMRQ